MVQIINPWRENPNSKLPIYYNVQGNEIYRNGDHVAYPDPNGSAVLHCYRNVAIACLVKLNKALIDDLVNGTNSNPDSSSYNFILNRAFQTRENAILKYKNYM